MIWFENAGRTEIRAGGLLSSGGLMAESERLGTHRMSQRAKSYKRKRVNFLL